MNAADLTEAVSTANRAGFQRDRSLKIRERGSRGVEGQLNFASEGIDRRLLWRNLRGGRQCGESLLVLGRRAEIRIGILRRGDLRTPTPTDLSQVDVRSGLIGLELRGPFKIGLRGGISSVDMCQQPLQTI